MSESGHAQPLADVDELKGAHIYADAVWNLAMQQDAGAQLIEEFRSLVHDVLDQQPELERFFKLGAISQDQRERLIQTAFAGRASQLLVEFLRTLNHHDRLGLLRAILLCLEELWSKAQGKVPVLVRSAVPLAADQLDKVQTMLVQRFGIVPDLQTETDPDLLGGLWIRVGDTVYDRSVRSNLRKLTENILASSGS